MAEENIPQRLYRVFMSQYNPGDIDEVSAMDVVGTMYTLLTDVLIVDPADLEEVLVLEDKKMIDSPIHTLGLDSLGLSQLLIGLGEGLKVSEDLIYDILEAKLKLFRLNSPDTKTKRDPTIRDVFEAAYEAYIILPK